ncbi:MAG: ATP-dependent Clp protease ATP-binding subunit [Patescibacteria group bacterium]
MQPNVVKKFTSYLKKAIDEAFCFAKEMNQKEVSNSYLVYGLLTQKGSLGSEILTKLGLAADTLKSQLVKLRVQNDVSFDEKNKVKKTVLSKNAKSAVEKAVMIARQHKHKYVGTEHLLKAVLENDDLEVKAILTENKIKEPDLDRQITLVLRSTSKFPDLTNLFDRIKSESGEELPAPPGMPTMTKTKSSVLEFFCTNLTDPIIQKNIDPVIGRNQEISRLISILSRRTKNNPALLGDAGVGKTAIVEGLAKRIITGEVPEVLINKKIFSLDLSLVVAGTIYRGEFESRIKQIIDEIKADPNIIIFIDELHTIIGAGSTQGSMDAANILKPALAKGQIRVIGATTPEEYKKHFESDAALERRFQAIYIKEPTEEETEEVLKGVRKNYEKYHRVTITDDAIEAAVTLSSRYIQDKFLPDKAIDLIDEASSKIKVANKSDGFIKKIKSLETELKNLRHQKHKAVDSEDFKRAIAIKSQEKLIMEKIPRLKEKQAMAQQKNVGRITKEDIASVISEMTKIPLHDLVVEEKERLLGLEKEIAKKIIGQEEAIEAIASSIRRSRTGISQPNRPLGSFIFLGPSGVGKTELAKVLAEVVFEDPAALIRIDMSEFGEGFNVSKLIGAPPGYVGYKESNKLTDQVKRKPYSVVLFDEIEKAHPEVFNLLLQVLEDGHLTDAIGKTINFKNTIIIMTSNIGLASLNKGAAFGFQSESEDQQKKAADRYGEIKERVLKELRKQFKPEFVNRIDKLLVFKPLAIASIRKIVELQIKELQSRLKEQEIKIELTAKAIDLIADKGFSPDQGARAIRKVIQERIEDPLAETLLTGKYKSGQTVKVKTEKKKLVLSK